jgi:hypothetical protein
MLPNEMGDGRRVIDRRVLNGILERISVTLNHSPVVALMARDARRCRAPPHEGLADLIPGMNAIAFTRGSIANGSRECAPDDRLRDASRRMKPPYWKMLSSD